MDAYDLPSSLNCNVGALVIFIVRSKFSLSTILNNCWSQQPILILNPSIFNSPASNGLKETRKFSLEFAGMISVPVWASD